MNTVQKNKRTYWAGTGKYDSARQRLYQLWEKYWPLNYENSKRWPALDRYFNASCYYRDLFNNGLANYRHEAKELFGFDCPWVDDWSPEDEDGDSGFCSECGHSHEPRIAEIDFESPDMEKYERAMDDLIRAAAKEQKIRLT